MKVYKQGEMNKRLFNVILELREKHMLMMFLVLSIPFSVLFSYLVGPMAINFQETLVNLDKAESFRTFFAFGSYFIMFLIPMGFSMAVLTRYEAGLKEYYLEDCGEVIKLHGAVKLIAITQARIDIRQVKPEYDLLSGEESFNRFGCTFATISQSLKKHEKDN